MAQEPENAFKTTTSCLPAYIQLRKWHLIAQRVAMVTFLSHILKCTHTHVGLEGSQATSFHDTQTLSQETFPGSQSQAAPKELGMRSSQLAPYLSGRRWVNSRSPSRLLRDLLESSFVVVDCFNVTALVFQKIGIVVVHLGVVGQGLHSWAVKRNRSRTLSAARLPHLHQVHLLLAAPPFSWKACS